MRILYLHNRYQEAGGEDSVFQAECDLMTSHQHEVEVLLADNADIVTPWDKCRAAVGAIYSTRSRDQVKRVISSFRPDVVHVHNFFPLLSPSVYDACGEAGVPVVQTLHNYRLACPNALFYREGRVCESCQGKRVPWPSVVYGCYRGSRLETAAVAGMLTVHRETATWDRKVAAFIAVSGFQKAKLVEAGLPADRIYVKPNFVNDRWRPVPRRPGSYLLYVGRLSEEKGVAKLVEAVIAHRLPIPLKIVGDGPLRTTLQAAVLEAGMGHVEFLGRREPSEVASLMDGARFLVSPSICYEGFPVTIVEAFARGLPVMASRLGGVPEIIGEGVTGWLVPPGDPAAWASSLVAAWSEPDAAVSRGRAARSKFEQLYTPKAAHARLLEIYRAALHR